MTNVVFLYFRIGRNVESEWNLSKRYILIRCLCITMLGRNISSQRFPRPTYRFISRQQCILIPTSTSAGYRHVDLLPTFQFFTCIHVFELKRLKFGKFITSSAIYKSNILCYREESVMQFLNLGNLGRHMYMQVKLFMTFYERI